MCDLFLTLMNFTQRIEIFSAARVFFTKCSDLPSEKTATTEKCGFAGLYLFSFYFKVVYRFADHSGIDRMFHCACNS